MTPQEFKAKYIAILCRTNENCAQEHGAQLGLYADAVANLAVARSIRATIWGSVASHSRMRHRIGRFRLSLLKVGFVIHLI